MCVHIYIYTYIYAYRTNASKYYKTAHTHYDIYINTSTSHIYTCFPSCIDVHIHIFIHVYILYHSSDTSTSRSSIDVHIHIFIHIYIWYNTYNTSTSRTNASSSSSLSPRCHRNTSTCSLNPRTTSSCVFLYVCECVDLYTCTHTNTWLKCMSTFVYFVENIDSIYHRQWLFRWLLRIFTILARFWCCW